MSKWKYQVSALTLAKTSADKQECELANRNVRRRKYRYNLVRIGVNEGTTKTKRSCASQMRLASGGVEARLSAAPHSSFFIPIMTRDMDNDLRHSALKTQDVDDADRDEW
jgi:hypothetical protein